MLTSKSATGPGMLRVCPRSPRGLGRSASKRLVSTQPASREASPPATRVRREYRNGMSRLGLLPAVWIVETPLTCFPGIRQVRGLRRIPEQRDPLAAILLFASFHLP